MFWPDTQTGVDVQPERKAVQSAVRKYFTEGGVGVPPTVPGGDWFNQITNEILSVLAEAGINPSKVDDTQLLDAIKLVSNSTSAFEALRRSYAEAGFALIGSFDVGCTVTEESQIVLLKSTGICYEWTGEIGSGHVVNPGTDPAIDELWWPVNLNTLRAELSSDAGALRVFHKSPIANAVAQSLADILNLQPITPEMFGADGSANGDTAALQAALAFARLTPCRIKLSRMYDVNQPLVCYYVQTHNTAISIVGMHRGAGLRIVADIPYALDLHGYRVNVENIRMLWAAITPSTTTALRVCGEKAIVSGVTGRGQFGKLVLAVAAIRSVFSNIMMNGGSINHCVGVQLMSCVNCCVTDCTMTACYCPVSFGALPYSTETSESLKPPSLLEAITWGNEGLSCGGLKSVMTMIGLVMSGLELVASHCTIDLTTEKPLFVGGLFIKLSHCWLQPNSSFSLVDAIGYTSSIGHLSITSCTLSGTSSATVNYNISADYLQMIGNVVYKSKANISGGGDRFLSGNIAGVDGVITKSAPSTGSVDIMTGVDKSTFSSGVILGKDTPNGDGKLQIRANSGERLFNGLTASGVILSTCPGGLGVSTVTPASTSVLYVGAISSTGRSINAAGTINASGADYAEYMRKAHGCGLVEKGQVVGINNSGEITDVFADAIAFAVKSTDPSLVGGNLPEWDVGYPAMPDISEPVRPDVILRRYGQSDEEYAAITAEAEARYESELIAYQAAISAHNAALIKWQADYDVAREPYDRIAFCGRVPCNTSGNPGDYVIPVRNADGGIGAVCVESPDFEQYKVSVGRVWSLLDDGRVVLTVKVC